MFIILVAIGVAEQLPQVADFSFGLSGLVCGILQEGCEKLPAQLVVTTDIKIFE